MEFSVFFKNLKINDFYPCDAEKLLILYKSNCKNETDFIQLYELKSILEVVNIFDRLHKAYLNCKKNNCDVLFTEIEELSKLLEKNSISCYSYSYYFYVYLDYIINYDKTKSASLRIFTDLSIFDICERVNLISSFLIESETHR